MYTGLQHLHSYTAYLTLGLLIVAFLMTLINHLGGKPYSDGNKKLVSIAMIFVHVQVLFGLILYFVSPLGLQNFSGENMGNSLYRLLFLEHPLMMILAAVWATIGNSKSKRAATDVLKYKGVIVFYGLALVFILSRIPWNNWFS